MWWQNLRFPESARQARQREPMKNLIQLREEHPPASEGGIYRAGLVSMHSGNASGIDRDCTIRIIKPGGIDYEKVTAALLVATGLHGRKLEPGNRSNPSVFLPHHLYLYARCPDVAAVVYSHSYYATSCATLARPIPAFLTANRDKLAPDIPCAPYEGHAGGHIGENTLQHWSRLTGESTDHSPSKHTCGCTESRSDARRHHKNLPPGNAIGTPTALSQEEVGKRYER
jgi:hypothetical protein